jgi:hypothetical protein
MQQLNHCGDFYNIMKIYSTGFMLRIEEQIHICRS